MAAVWLLFLLLALGPSAHGAPHKPKSNGISDLADTVDKTLNLNKFAALMQASDLGTFLSSRGPFTLFVPVNSAFSKLPPGMFEDLLRPENKVQLQRIILFQLVSGRAWDVKDMATTKSLLSCEGTALALRTSHSGTQYVGKARIIRGNIRCANGLMHQVDTLLMPPHLLLVAAVAPPDGTGAASTNAAPVTNAPPDPPAGTNGVPAPSSVTNAPAETVVPAPVGPSMR
jgi:uncharacterized surface protein with fasciclin (FAS1) repeats